MSHCTKRRLNTQNEISDSQKGFTLIELVIVIVILGIVSISISGIVRGAMEAVITVSERENLVREGSYLVERFNRELAGSVPNSVRISGNASVHCVEFVPLKWNGLYLSLPLIGQASNTVDLIELSDIQNRSYSPTTSDFAIVYPTRATQVYNASVGHRRQVVSCTDDDNDCGTLGDADKVIQLEVSDGFVQTSPSNRIYFAQEAVSYCMRNNQVYRHENSIAQTQSLYTSGGTLMAQNLVNVLGLSANSGEQNPFNSIGATSKRNASTQALFMFGRDEERVTFMQEVQIPNVP
jgi:MSHA biogenesis protein MshO